MVDFEEVQIGVAKKIWVFYADTVLENLVHHSIHLV